ncbi:unnamed protein product, partial [Prorocentrum cordatum]
MEKVAFGQPLLIARRGHVELEVYSYNVPDAMVAGFFAGAAEGECEVLGGGAGPGPAVEVFIGDLPTIQECGEGMDEKWLQHCDELPPIPTFPTLEVTTVQSCVGFEAIEGTAEVPSVAGPSDEEMVIKLEFENGVGAGGAGLKADSERVETTAEVPTVLHTNMGQLAVGSASRDMLEFVSRVDVKDVEDLPRETIKLEDKLDHAAGEAHLPEETVKLQDDNMPRNEFAVQAVVVQEMAMHEALVDVAVQGEVPSAGVRRSWEATVEANQLAHARAAAAAACRHAQWRLEHDELEGVALHARSEEVQQFEELVVEGSFE